MLLSGVAVGASSLMWLERAGGDEVPQVERRVTWEYATYAHGETEIPTMTADGFAMAAKPFAYWEDPEGRRQQDGLSELEETLGVKDRDILNWAGKQGWELVTYEREMDGRHSRRLTFKRPVQLPAPQQ